MPASLAPLSSQMRDTLNRAADHLARGGCVAMPTETVYGLAARVDSTEGIANIFKLKLRPSFDPLIVHISDLEQISELTDEWPPIAQSLAEKFWPGPLTLIVKKKPSINPMITSGLESIGVRMPNHPLALELIHLAGHPLAAPSANRFGRTSPTSAQHVMSEFQSEIERGSIQVINGGDCDVGVESTVCLVRPDEIVILRPGGVTGEALIGHFVHSKEFQHVRVTMNVGHHASPGHTEHHYETRKPLIVSWSEKFGEREKYQIGEMTLAKTRVHEIDLPQDPALAARVLYARLREGDQHPDSEALFLRRDVTKQESRTGLWQAIDDRIKRAARLVIGTPPKPGV